MYQFNPFTRKLDKVGTGGSGTGGADGINRISAGTQLAGTNTTVVFSNSNNVSFGMTNNSIVTASASMAQSTQPVAISGSNGSFSFSTVTFGNLNGMSFYTSNGSMVGSYTVPTQTAFVFSNSNGVTFGTNGSTVTASHNGLTSQSNQAVSGSNGSFAFQTVTFGNLNGVSFYTSNGSLVASYTVPTQSVQTQNMVSVNGSTGNISLATGSSLSSSSNGSTITFGLASNITTALQSANANYLTSQSNQAFSASGGSSTFQTLNFANSNGLTFSNSNGSVIGSYTVPTVTQYLSATNTTFNGTNASGSLTLNTNGLRVDVSVNPGGGATPVASASNGSFSFTTLGFSNANNVTFGTSAGSIITASVAAPGAAAENNAVNLLGANTAGNTTATGSTIGWSGQNITLSGTNGSQVVISAPATSSLSATGQVSISTNGSTISIGVPQDLTLSYFNPQDAYLQVTGQQGQGTLHIQPMQAPNVQFDRLMMPIVNTNSSNSSGSHTLSFWAGIYTRNDSTLSMLYSASTSTAVTHSGTAGSYSLMSGMRLLSMGFTQTLTAGQYWMGILSRTTSGGANGSYSQMLASQVNSSFFGLFGQSVNSTYQYTRGLGTYSATTNEMPASVAFSQIRGASNSLVLRQPIFYLVSGTV